MEKIRDIFVRFFGGFIFLRGGDFNKIADSANFSSLRDLRSKSWQSKFTP
ncbi:hypothetical protein [Helicobacter sp. 23-1045]